MKNQLRLDFLAFKKNPLCFSAVILFGMPYGMGLAKGTKGATAVLQSLFSPKGGRMKKSATTVTELIELRKKSWQMRKSPEHDALMVEAIAEMLTSVPELSLQIKQKPYLLIEACFTIVDKKKSCVPFFLNEVQRDFICQIETLGTKKPFFVLKGRQQGFTSLITAIQLCYALSTENFSGFTIADRDDNTKAIFVDKAKAIYNKLPSCLKPSERFNSVNELFFEELNSSWRVCPASSNIGRSRTLSFIHFSEVAFFKCPISDLQKSVVEAACENALIIYETTANGFNDAKELWDSNSCHKLFYEWWKTKEYVSNEYEYLKNADTWLKNRLNELKKRGLSLEQRTWYAKKYASYIDKSSIKQEYPCSPHEAFVSSGDSIFDKERLSEMISSFNIKSRLGYFEYERRYHGVYGKDKSLISCFFTLDNIHFVESDSGYIRIVDEPYNEKRGALTLKKPYVIGADTAGAGADYFAARVIDNTTGRAVATLKKQYIDEDLFAEQLYCLGKYYNSALIGIETNFSSQPIRHLKALGYENLYVSKNLSTFSDESEKHYGFVTTSVSRPIIISNLVSIMRECPELETDIETLIEMTTFVRRRDGRVGACDGAHDDLVMATAIARFISIEYEHSIIRHDSSMEIINSSFSSSSNQNDTFMEW